MHLDMFAMVVTKIVICITNRQEHRICLVKHKRMPDFYKEEQPQPAQGSQWASVHSSPPAKTLPQQQLLESNRGTRILQPQATVREMNHRNQIIPPGLQHLRTAFDIKELLPQDQHHELGNPRAFSHCAQGRGNMDSATATRSLCTAHRVSSDTRLQHQMWLYSAWVVRITVREQQQCHAQAGGKDTGVFLLRATLLGLAAQTGGSISRAFGRRALGNGNSLTWCRSSSGCLGQLVSLELHQTVLHSCTDRKMILQLQLYLRLTLIFTSPQHTPKLVTVTSAEWTEAEKYFFPNHYLKSCKI